MLAAVVVALAVLVAVAVVLVAVVLVVLVAVAVVLVVLVVVVAVVLVVRSCCRRGGFPSVRLVKFRCFSLFFVVFVKQPCTALHKHQQQKTKKTTFF